MKTLLFILALALPLTARAQYVPPSGGGPALSSLVVGSDGYLVATFADGSTKTSSQRVAPDLTPYVQTTDNRLTLATTALQSVALANSTTPGLMPPTALVQVKTPIIPFFVPGAAAAVSVGSASIWGIKVQKALTIQGFDYYTSGGVGTNYSFTLSLMVNGSPVPNSAATGTLSSSQGTITLANPLAVNPGDRIEILRTVTVAIAVLPGITYGTIQATYP